MPPKGLSKFRKAKEHIKVAEGHYNNNKNADALAIINALMPQLRRWDDKSLLVEIHLLESRVYDAVHNLSKAKAALAASRTAANAVYVSPLQQAALDLQSGILGAEDKDFKTAFSYLYEAFEAYHQSATQNATQAAGHAETVAKSQELAQLALKYMLLCKIMANRADEVTQILAGKNAMKYQGRGVDAMRRVAKAFKARDLHEFKQVEAEYSDVFKADPLLNSQLDDLYEAMLEQHLLRTVEPYSQVQITHIASIVKLSPVDVERKLSQMILDKQLYGTIDQSNQCLIVYDDDADEESFEPALGTIEGMSKVIDALSENYTKAMAGDYDKKEDEKKSAKPEDVVKETGNAADDTHKKADADAVDPPKKGGNDQTK